MAICFNRSTVICLKG